jgi:ABC-type Mn2+/Zn2+ transport system ATPase subunit
MSINDWRVSRGPTVDIGPFDLNLGPGQVAVFMGPSGVGKTTLLLSFLGYQDRDVAISGSRHHRGESLRQGDVPSRSLYIPQNLPFNPNWEVQAFLRILAARDHGHRLSLMSGCRECRSRITDALVKVGLGHRAHAIVSELSGGESQRAALAQLHLLRDKLDIVVADEFVSATDPGMALSILDDLKNVLTSVGGVGLLALHDVHASLRIANQIVVVWPASITPVPWSVTYNSPAWDADVIHTMLCLARWLTGVEPSPATKQLMTALHEVICCKPESCDGRKASPLVMFGNETEQYHIGLDMERFFLEEDGDEHLRHPNPHAIMAPVRIMHDGLEFIGFTYLRAQQRLRVLAIVRRGQAEELRF